jgi:hypothetical protein
MNEVQHFCAGAVRVLYHGEPSFWWFRRGLSACFLLTLGIFFLASSLLYISFLLGFLVFLVPPFFVSVVTRFFFYFVFKYVSHVFYVLVKNICIDDKNMTSVFIYIYMTTICLDIICKKSVYK